jgi:hypothetical protein
MKMSFFARVIPQALAAARFAVFRCRGVGQVATRNFSRDRGVFRALFTTVGL